FTTSHAAWCGDGWLMRVEPLFDTIEHAARSGISIRLVNSEERSQDAAESILVEVADQSAGVTDRDLAGFLRDNYGNGVTLLGNTNAGSVSGTQGAAGGNVIRERQYNTRREDAVAADDHGGIVQG